MDAGRRSPSERKEFSGIAERVGRSQPALSKCIRRLETEIGTREDPALSPEADLIRRVDAAAIESAIGTLARPYREVLVLHDINDLSYKEIAAMMSIPIGTVMSRLSRARRQVAKEIGQVSS